MPKLFELLIEQRCPKCNAQFQLDIETPDGDGYIGLDEIEDGEPYLFTIFCGCGHFQWTSAVEMSVYKGTNAHPTKTNFLKGAGK